ncbi:hypothetical protein EBE87_25375 [Pseudoroseomonas wenyumeiae]|uniref:Uncharacterized protein n=1 Tax=Teichococcus wenyumeiae TaxID=2478470 RepID=A0A3A9JEP4_9PROT|nr:hypothetical protein [Pseudoroseomonas wenyumeiae]RKK03025.1 hypothetical protein D6Z83_16625 [Pseudoroseomonas wenyumeiae]RMI15519.1 hypothetical protein EBE87_25375 [Pseudoroseomonas wenyumeiae]
MLTLESLLAERAAQRQAKLTEQRALLQQVQQEQDERRRRFESYLLTEEDAAKIQSRIRKAFADNEQEVMLGSFPSDFCADGGRRINHALPDWEESLIGAAKQVHEFWKRELNPGGFGFSARIINYPDGMPGDVGLFITWHTRKE